MPFQSRIHVLRYAGGTAYYTGMTNLSPYLAVRRRITTTGVAETYPTTSTRHLMRSSRWGFRAVAELSLAALRVRGMAKLSGGGKTARNPGRTAKRNWNAETPLGRKRRARAMARDLATHAPRRSGDKANGHGNSLPLLRWPSKAELVHAAVARAGVQHPAPVADTGPCTETW